MHIEDLHVDGFGHLRGTRLSLTPGLVCVLGENEVGKSTLLGFVRGVLFGFGQSLSTEQKEHMGVDGRIGTIYDPVEGGTKGGSLTLVVDGDGVNGDGNEQRYRFTRTKVRKNDGDLKVVDLARGKEHSGEEAERLRLKLLGSIDATLFGTVFALGLDELHAVKALDKDAVHGVLFTADAGIATSLATEMAELGKTLDERFKTKGSKPHINTLKRQWRELEKEIRTATDEVASHKGHQEAYDAAKQAITDCEERRMALIAELDKAERRANARSILQRIQSAEAELARHGDQALPTPEDRATHEDLKAELRRAMDKRDDAKERLSALKLERERLVYDERDAAAAALLPTVPDDLDPLVANAAEHRRLQSLAQNHDGPYLAPQERDTLLRLDDRIGSIKEQVEAAGVRLEQAEARCKAAETGMLDETIERRLRSLLEPDAARLGQEHQEALRGRDEAVALTDHALRGLGAGWDRTRLAAAPTDHVTVNEVTNTLRTGQDTMRHIQRPIPLLLVGGLLALLGGVGLSGLLLDPISGIVLLAAGAIVLAVGLTKGGPTQTTDPEPAPRAERALRPYGLPATTTRDAFTGFVAALRSAEERRNTEARIRERCRQIDEHIQALDAGIADALRNLGLDTQGDLPERQHRIRVRLQGAQDARSQRDAAATTRTERRQELQEAQGTHERSLNERQALLTRCGLAPDAPDDAVRQVLAASTARDDLTERLEALARDAERFDRLERSLAEVQALRGEDPPSLERFPQTLRRITEACQAARTTQQDAERIDRERKQADHDLARAEATVSSQKEALTAFHARFGCADADAFHAALANAEAVKETQARIRLEEDRLIDLEATYPALRKEATTKDPEEDALLLANREDRLGSFREEIQKWNEQAEEHYAVLARVRDQDALSGLLQERDALQQELEDAVRDWLRLAMTKKLLEKARDRYDRDHGPRVLQEAGRILETITDGRYHSITRGPDGTYTLERPDGRRVPAVPPSLSRGTFAQVYLAIRLAYAQVNDDPGVPYLLDDVLSDFDDERLDRIIEVLARMAERRQVVLFTHHGHVAKRIAAAGLTVTSLAAAGPQVEHEIA